MEISVTSGHLCVKGRFGFEFVQVLPRPGSTGSAQQVAAEASSAQGGDEHGSERT